MNYSEALSFVFRDEEWIKKLAIGGLITFVSFYAGLFFIGGFFILGYYVMVMRNVMQGEEKALPDWTDLSKIFVDGVLGAVITLVYFIIIGAIGASIIVALANDPFMPDFERVLGIVGSSLTMLFLLMIFINFGIMQFAATNNFGQAFSIGRFLSLLKNEFGNFFAVVVFSFILHGILLCVGLGIISPFTNFWGLMVQAHLFGQCAQRIDELEDSIAKVEPVPAT